MRGHVQRMRVARRDRAVLARDLQRFPFAARHVVGVNEIVHGPRMVRIASVDLEEDFGGAIGMGPGCRIGGRGRQQRQRIERRRVGIVRKRGIHPFRGLFPPADAGPVIG